jgi:tetratricopeptide (TPR) repeat protein
MFCSKMRFFPSAIFALTLCHVVSLAQVPRGPAANGNLEIHGQVRFSEGGAPAQNVLVRLESYDGGGSISEAFTDRSGKFRFSGLFAAQYAVKVHQAGYLDTQQTVDLQTSSSGYVMLQLSRDNSRPVASISTAGSIDANVPAAAQKEFDKGVAILAEGNKSKTVEAAKHFERALALYPQFVAASLKLGTVYMDLEQWDKAERALLSTIDLDPRAANAFFALGEIYLQQNKNQEAEKVLLKGLQIEDRSFLGHLNLARVYWERARKNKDLADAKPTLEKSYNEVKHALQLKPDLAAAHLLKGNLLLRVSRTTDAVAEFDEYLRLEPKGALASETRALVDKITTATSHNTAKP